VFQPFRLRALASSLALFAVSLTACSDTNADLIVYGDWVLPMDSAGTRIADGAVVISGDSIVAVGARSRIDARWRAPRTIEGTNRVVLPGLINGHTHAAMTLLRGVADDLELMTWLEQYIFPLEGQFVSPEFVRVGTELACYEMIRSGTTRDGRMPSRPPSTSPSAGRVATPASRLRLRRMRPTRSRPSICARSLRRRRDSGCRSRRTWPSRPQRPPTSPPGSTE